MDSFHVSYHGMQTVWKTTELLKGKAAFGQEVGERRQADANPRACHGSRV